MYGLQNVCQQLGTRQDEQNQALSSTQQSTGLLEEDIRNLKQRLVASLRLFNGGSGEEHSSRQLSGEEMMHSTPPFRLHDS